jgi:hypothetical protein
LQKEKLIAIGIDRLANRRLPTIRQPKDKSALEPLQFRQPVLANFLELLVQVAA